MNKLERKRTQWLLQCGVEMRMRAIQQRISMTFTFCNTIELTIHFCGRDQGTKLLHKLRSTIDGLAIHIDDPAHVSGKHYKDGFREPLAQLRQRLVQLDSQMTMLHGSETPRWNRQTAQSNFVDRQL